MDPCRGRRMLSIVAGLGLIALAGCGAYTPRGVAGMDSVDICEMEYMQGRNLSAQAKQAMQSELAKRNDNCRSHATEVAQRFEDFMLHETYGGLSP